jgi:Holliday junction resolvase RusA-like endonuclease
MPRRRTTTPTDSSPKPSATSASSISEIPELYLSVPGRPPAKANSYKVGQRRRKGGGTYPTLLKDDGVARYEAALGWIAKAALGRLGLETPAISAGYEVEVWVVWHRGDTNADRHKDVDGVLKAVLDSLNKIVWKDDSQISDLHARRVHDAASVEDEWVELIVAAEPARSSPKTNRRSRSPAS